MKWPNFHVKVILFMYSGRIFINMQGDILFVGTYYRTSQNSFLILGKNCSSDKCMSVFIFIVIHEVISNVKVKGQRHCAVMISNYIYHSSDWKQNQAINYSENQIVTISLC